ncbi:MAG TPA: coniferyl aldehyde dehydrogenase [Gemmataceae bacterium]|nr:coniferyl aldehyde dehydrogenase [Gemmataceae bacterium]
MTQPPTSAIADLDTVFQNQRLAFQRNPYPSTRDRRAQLDALCRLLLSNRDAIAGAISADFGHRSYHETQFLELMPAVRGARHARANVARWMRPERKPVSVWFKFGRARVFRQPLGVVGIIVPWNYPLLLAVGPLVAAVAAGNRAMLKISEFTPTFGQLFAELIAGSFSSDQIAVVNGGVDVARAFAAKPFDHLLFTGGGAVGRELMKAAAANLTPVTLELGGKSPAIVGPHYPVDLAAQRILWGKCLNAGQSCIAPDYVLLPGGKEAAFTAAAQEQVRRFYPAGASGPDYSSIIHARHYQRLTSCLADAVAKGASPMPLMEGQSESARKFPPTILQNVNDDMLVMQDEIFGPLLPLVPYGDLDEALRYVTARPRPLALYYFDDDRRRIQRILESTPAGGVTINDTMLHFAQEDLPFGGVGPSGMGQYHGEDGFLTFSKRKGVFLQSRCNAVGMLNPPYGKRTETLIKWMS